MTLAGKKLVVIGASSGVGLATAKRGAAEGARVVIGSSSAERLERAKAELPGDVEAHAVDVSNEQDVERFFAAVGALDHLVVTAVSRTRRDGTEDGVEAARKAFETKFWGTMYAVKHAVPRLNRESSITLFSGVAAWAPNRGGWGTAAINGALAALTRTLAVELAPIRVNAVSPGLIVTDGLRLVHDDVDAFVKDAAAGLPVGRVGEPEDVAASVLYLVQNRFTTGTTIHVEGGRRLIW